MRKDNNILTDFFISYKNNITTRPICFVLGTWIFGLTMLLIGHPFCNMDGPLTNPNLLAWVFCPNGKNGLEAPLSS